MSVHVQRYAGFLHPTHSGGKSLYCRSEDVEPLEAFVNRCHELGAVDTDIVKHALEDQARIREQVPLSIELDAWRAWAQFVYLGGGAVTRTDDELRTAVCEAHDAYVAAARAEGR